MPDIGLDGAPSCSNLSQEDQQEDSPDANQDVFDVSVNPLIPPEHSPVTPRKRSEGDHEASSIWDLDNGFIDYDIGNNDDANVIFGSPSTDLGVDLGSTPGNFAAKKPIPISIPRSLEPLAQRLHEKPIDLLVSSLLFDNSKVN